MIKMQASTKCKEDLNDKASILDIHLANEKDGLVMVEISSNDHTIIGSRVYVDGGELKKMIDSIMGAEV